MIRRNDSSELRLAALLSDGQNIRLNVSND
jgi:hypothetical protein